MAINAAVLCYGGSCRLRKHFNSFSVDYRQQRLCCCVRKLREQESTQHDGRIHKGPSAEFHNLHEMRHSAALANKVFIQRDYSQGTACRFQTKFPLELNSRMEQALFAETVKTLNSYYAEAEKVGGQSYLEGCLACATAYIIFLCLETRYEKNHWEPSARDKGTHCVVEAMQKWGVLSSCQLGAPSVSRDAISH
ncbi:unnamed protein product [Boreogadus saida]